uniref:PWWP domain-containing protein n=1 Tax=Gasterosteus aculeatus TaxID=69293 RepID=G3N5A5_GASAC
SRDQYKQGDLVFAKMKGFPHWPARIFKPDNGNKKRVLVFFFGTHQIGQVLLKNIVPFVGNKMKYGCGVRSKGFSEGMWEIQNTPGVGSKPKPPAKAPPAKAPPTKAPPATSSDKPSQDQLKSTASSKRLTRRQEAARVSLRSAPQKTLESKPSSGETSASTRSRRSAAGGRSEEEKEMASSTRKTTTCCDLDRLSEKPQAAPTLMSKNKGGPREEEESSQSQASQAQDHRAKESPSERRGVKRKSDYGESAKEEEEKPKKTKPDEGGVDGHKETMKTPEGRVMKTRRAGKTQTAPPGGQERMSAEVSEGPPEGRQRREEVPSRGLKEVSHGLFLNTRQEEEQRRNHREDREGNSEEEPRATAKSQEKKKKKEFEAGKAAPTEHEMEKKSGKSAEEDAPLTRKLCAEYETKPQKKSDNPVAEESGGAAAAASEEAQSGSSGGAEAERRSPAMTLTDSTLHRIHGDIRISLKTDNPDIRKCLTALDQLSMVYVTCKHVQRHSELVSTLRKLRSYRANRAVMDKAAMLYSRFKNAFLVGEGEEVVSAAFLRSLLEEKEREEAQRAERGRGKGGRPRPGGED